MFMDSRASIMLIISNYCWTLTNLLICPKRLVAISFERLIAWLIFEFLCFSISLRIWCASFFERAIVILWYTVERLYHFHLFVLGFVDEVWLKGCLDEIPRLLFFLQFQFFSLFFLLDRLSRLVKFFKSWHSFTISRHKLRSFTKLWSCCLFD